MASAEVKTGIIEVNLKLSRPEAEWLSGLIGNTSSHQNHNWNIWNALEAAGIHSVLKNAEGKRLRVSAYGYEAVKE